MGLETVAVDMIDKEIATHIGPNTRSFLPRTKILLNLE
jgi:hypothetical protein